MSRQHIEQEILIVADPRQTFEVLTNQVDAWWAHGYYSPHSTVHLESQAGGRFYEDFGPGQGSALYATVTHLEPGKTIRLMGPMGMNRLVVGTVSFDLEPDAKGTRLKLSHQIMGDIDDQQVENYAAGWQELLGQHFKRLVEQGKGYREA